MNKMKKILSVVVLFAVILSSFTVFADGPFTKNITKTAGYDNLIKIKGDIDRESYITLLVLKTGNYGNSEADADTVRAKTMDSELATSTIGFVSEQYCTVNSGDFNDFDFSFYVPDGAQDGDFYTIWVGNTQTGNTILESGFIYRQFDPKVSLVKTDDEGQQTTDYTSKVAVATSGFSTYSYFPLASGKVSDQVDIKRWKLFESANGENEIKSNLNYMIANYSGLKALQVKNNAVATNANTKDLYIRGYYLDNAYENASSRPSGNGIDYSQLKYAATTGTTAYLDNYVEGKITVLPPAKLSSFTSSNNGNEYTFTMTSDSTYAQPEDINYDIQYKISGGANVSFQEIDVSGNTATKKFDVSTLPAGDYYITGTVANKYSQQLVQDKKTLETTVSATGSGPLYKIKKIEVPEAVVAGQTATFTASVFDGTTPVTSGIDTLVKIYDRVDKVGNPVADVKEQDGDGVIDIELPKVGQYVVTISVKKTGDKEYHSAGSVVVSAVESAELTSANFATSFALEQVDENNTNITLTLPANVTLNQGGTDGYSMFVALENANKVFDSAIKYGDAVTVTNGSVTVPVPQNLKDAEVVSAVVSYRSNATGQVYTYIADITE